MEVYVYNDILALFSLKPYDEIIQLNDRLVDFDLKPHITNTCFQLEDLNLKKDCLYNLESNCVNRFWNIKFDENSEKENMIKKNLIFSQIKECIYEIFNCLSNEPIGKVLRSFIILYFILK